MLRERERTTSHATRSTSPPTMAKVRTGTVLLEVQFSLFIKRVVAPIWNRANVLHRLLNEWVLHKVRILGEQLPDLTGALLLASDLEVHL